MLKKTINYKDFDGVDRQEDFYFNLSRSEVAKMELTKAGGMKAHLEKILAENDGQEIMDFFEKIIRTAYGERTQDGRFFDKSPERADRFMNSAAYDELFMELMRKPDFAAEFIQAIIPQLESQN